MWFQSLTLNNVTIHRHRTFKFKCGLIGLFGPNGCGKSTVLDAMYALVTNDYSRFFQGKKTVINHNSGERDPASISGTVIHENHKLEIFRGLRRPVGHRLRVDEEREITDANKIEERIFDVLGTSPDILKLYVFKRQNEIFDFISATDSVRKKSFQSLCRAEVCEELYQLFGESLNKDVDLRTETLDNSDDLRASIDTLKAEIAALETERETQAGLLLSPKSKKSATEIIGDADRRAELTGKQKDNAKKISTLTKQIAEAEQRATRREKRLAKAEKKFKRLKKSARAAAASLESWKTYETQVKQKEAAEATKAELEEHGKIPSPKIPKNYAKFDGKKSGRTLTRMQGKLKFAQRAVDKLDDEGVVACPICHTPTDKLHDYVEEQRELVKTLPGKISKLKAKIERMETYEEKVRTYQKWKAGHDARVTANVARLKEFDDLEQPEGDKVALQKTVDEFETVENLLPVLRERLSNVREYLASKKGKLTSAEARRTEIAEGLNISIDAGLLEKAQRRMAEHDAAQEEVARIDGRIDAKRESLKSKKTELTELTTKLKRNKTQRKLLRVIERAREHVHYSALPTRVSQANLSLMESDINKNLGRFRDPFWVESDENLQFVAHKPGEPAQFAQQLSTGLRVVLAIPFWLSMASLWKTGIGMLALDEPTAHLDEDNRASLSESLQSLTAKLRGSQQILMTTHAEELKPCFDQVVMLDYEQPGED